MKLDIDPTKPRVEVQRRRVRFMEEDIKRKDESLKDRARKIRQQERDLVRKKEQLKRDNIWEDSKDKIRQQRRKLQDDKDQLSRQIDESKGKAEEKRRGGWSPWCGRRGSSRQAKDFAPTDLNLEEISLP